MPETPSEPEQRLESVLADYLHAVAAGTPPDHAELIAQHPDLAADLRSFFRNREAMELIAAPIKRQLPEAETIGVFAPASAGVGTTVRYFGDYELLGEIARGGMGVVYKARQVSLNRLVALKMILGGQLASEADVKRFHAEAEAAAHLDHPNIVPIHEIGLHEGDHYYAMQFVDGPSLATHLRSTSWSNRDATALIRTCAEAVQYAHERGVVHRDLKPGNILLAPNPKFETRNPKQIQSTKNEYPSPEQAGSQLRHSDSGSVSDFGFRDSDFIPRITDFGLAKRVGHGTSLTASGQIVGTPSYMAPEQASGKKEVGPAVDVYALGAILYELLTGRPPFQAETQHETVQQVITEEPVPPSHVQPKVPRDLENICLKCLEKRPGGRYGSARALADDLGRFLNYEPIHARPVSRARRFGVWVRKRPWAIVGLALLTILAVTLVAQSFYLENQRQSVENLYREARIARLELAGQPAPKAGDPLRPAAKRALQSLRLAAEIRPAGRLYEEALDVLLVERRGGEHIYPKPDGKTALPREWVQSDTEFPRPFTLTRDARLLLFPDVCYHIDTGTTTPLPDHARPAGPEFSGDGRFVARIADSEITIHAVATGALTSRISASSVSAVALSPDGTALAWSQYYSGASAKVHVVRVADGAPIRELLPTGPVAVVRLAYTPDGKFVIGQTGYSERDVIYYSSGRMPDGKLTPVYQEHTDRVCIWDAADGKLLAWLPGRAFADGFGPRGELAVVRPQGSADDAYLEIDVWRPAELLAALEQMGLTSWIHFADRPSQGTAAWLVGLGFAAMFAAMFWGTATTQRVQKKRITARWAHLGIGLTLLLVGIGVLCFMAVVAEFTGHWGRLIQLNSDNLNGIVCALIGLGDLLIAVNTGGLAIKCYTHATYGEAVAEFEQLQAIPEAEQELAEQRAKQFGKSYWRWFLGFYLGMGIILGVVAYVDGSGLLGIYPLVPFSWGGLLSALWGWYTITTMTLIPGLSVLLLLYLIVAIADAKWGPAKQPWMLLPAAAEPTRQTRFMVRVVNLFPLGRKATIAYWLLVLLAGLGLAGFEVYARLASGDWPFSEHAYFAASSSTEHLAMAVFHVLLSLVRLVRIVSSAAGSDHIPRNGTGSRNACCS